MKNIQIKSSIGIAVILIVILVCVGIYYGIASLNEEAFHRGFNAGSEAQKMLDDLNNHQTNKLIPQPKNKINILHFTSLNTPKKH